MVDHILKLQNAYSLGVILLKWFIYLNLNQGKIGVFIQREKTRTNFFEIFKHLGSSSLGVIESHQNKRTTPARLQCTNQTTTFLHFNDKYC